MTLSCIIVDDEPIAQQIIEDYVESYPELKLVAKCRDAHSAFAAIRNYTVDLIFLDVQMPKISGIELIKSLQNPPIIILTTAYPEYAVEGFEENVADYLLKPISFPRFAKAIERVLARKSPQASPSPASTNEPGTLRWLVKSGNKSHNIAVHDILVIEGLENYVKLICEDQEIVTLNTLNALQEKFKDTPLTRIHKSYIVNLQKIDYVESIHLSIHKKRYPIGPSYRKEVSNRIQKWFDSLG